VPWQSGRATENLNDLLPGLSSRGGPARVLFIALSSEKQPQGGTVEIKIMSLNTHYGGLARAGAPIAWI
jgi:hypothetical protein